MCNVNANYGHTCCCPDYPPPSAARIIKCFHSSLPQEYPVHGSLPGRTLYGENKEGTGMATTDIVPQESSGQLGQRRVVNDMSIQVATVNGSGSQSSNTVLLRSIFQMGVPISGKNLFPSNIAGLPTW